ncbi:MAG: 5'-nucleotidase C-terminal domain-containing protein [Bacteroidota bacterium]
MKNLLFLPFFLLLFTCQRHYLPTEASPQSYRISQQMETANSEEIAAIIAPYKQSLDEQMNQVIGQAAKRLYKDRPESPLGNWLADLLYRQATALSKQPVDAAYQNYGGIRIPEIAAGPITRSTVYELMPFDNMLVIVEMDGATVQRFFNHLAERGGDPVSEQVQFVLQAGKADQLRLSGQAVERGRTYRIAMPDYIANGGDNANFLTKLPREDTGHLIRDLILAEVEATTEPITAQLSNRIILGD